MGFARVWYQLSTDERVHWAPRAAVPKHTRVRVFPVNRERFVYLEVLAGFDAAPTKNALLWVVAIERIRMVFFVGLVTKRDALMLNA